MDKPTLDLDSVQPNQDSGQLAWKLIGGIFIVIVVVAAIYLSSQPSHRFSMHQFNQLQTGISYDQAQQIMDSPGAELSSSEMFGIKTVCISWKNEDGSNILVTFQNDKLISKAQANLE